MAITLWSVRAGGVRELRYIQVIEKYLEQVCWILDFVNLLHLTEIVKVNFVVLSAIAYSSWRNWQKPRWDRKVVSSVGIGLMTLLGGEWYIMFPSQICITEKN